VSRYIDLLLVCLIGEICSSVSPSLIPLAARSKAWVSYRPLAVFAGSHSAWGMDVLSVVSVVL
jgi:hypothetical protein